jgi:AcrR family transcriptional regulator
MARQKTTTPPTTPPRRRRNAAATRDAILASARQCFARSGYDGAGVRQIAAGAGVTAMLVNRYFGSKEELFAEAIADAMSRPTILTPENLGSSGLGETIAATLVEITKKGAVPLEGFQILLRSAGSERAAQIGKEQIEKHYHKTLSLALEGESAAQRAALVLAMVAGVQVMRQMIGLSALTKTKPEVLVKILAPLFQQLVEPAS